MALIVTTGANGFIGSNLLERLIKLDPTDLGLPAVHQPRFNEPPMSQDWGFDLLGTDLISSLNRATASRFVGSARYKFVPHDALFATLDKLSEPPLCIIHNGACSSTLATNAEIFKTLNVEYSKAVWRYCAANRVPMIYASSASVYGDGSLGFSDRKEDCAKYTPMHLYGKSKLDFDLWALEQSQTPPTWFGLRYFNVYGPFETHKEDQISMVLRGYQQILKQGFVRLFKSNVPEFGDGEQERDFIYVQDVVHVTTELLKLALKRQKSPNLHPIDGNGLILNVGTGKPRNWKDLVTSIFAGMGIPPKIEYIPMPEQLAKQYQNYTCADVTQLKQLGLSIHFTELEDGVREYVQKYLIRGL